MHVLKAALFFFFFVVGCDASTPEPDRPVESNPTEQKTPDVVEPDRPKPTVVPYIAEPGFLTVNGTEVSAREFNRKMELIASFAQVVDAEEIERFRDSAVEELTEQALLKQLSKGEEIDEAEFERTVASIKEGVKDLDAHLKKLGQTRAEFESEIRDSLRVRALVDSKLQITDEDMRLFYKTNRVALSEPEKIRASHILFRIEKGATDEKRAEVKALADRVAARAKVEDFESLVTEFGGGSKSSGDLGWFPRKQMVKEFSAAAFALSPGSVSEPVKTVHGYHVIKVVDKREAFTPSFESLKPQIEETLRSRRSRTAIRELISKTKSSAKVKVDRDKIRENPEFAPSSVRPKRGKILRPSE